MRLCILTSHPIQYYAPWFRKLTALLELQVFFAHRQDAAGQASAGFGVKFEWDVPLTDGYPHRWLVNVSAHPGLGSFNGCDTPELYEIVKSERYDAFLILGWNRKSYLQGIRACRRVGTPVLMRGDSQLRTPRSAIRSFLKYLPYRCLLPRLDGHLYVGQRNREYLRHYGVTEKRLFFAPHFVDNEFFASRAVAARETGRAVALRDELKIPRDAFVVLFVGKFIPKKRPLDLVQAAQLLVQNGRIPNLHLLFVGSGELGPRLRESCNIVFDIERRDFALRIPPSALPKASFAGFKNQSELPLCYATADVLVLPSDGGETWGLVVNEAMACGLPAVVSDAAGCGPDMIEEDATGFTYPLGDIATLADRLTRIRLMPLGHPVTSREAALAKVSQYSMESATAGLLQACDAVRTRTRRLR